MMMSKKSVQNDAPGKPANISGQARKVKYLEGLNQSKSEFVAAVSHELRTPLAIIKQLILLMYDGTAGPITDKQMGSWVMSGKISIA